MTENPIKDPGDAAMFVAYHDVIKPQFRRYLEFEPRATEIGVFHPWLVPALGQTERYARWLVTHRGTTDDPPVVKARQVQLRMARQAHALRDGGPHLTMIIDETVFARRAPSTITPHGDQDEMMAEQVQHLRALAARPRLDIRVLPLNSSLLPVPLTPFIVLTAPGEVVAYLERLPASELLTVPSQVTPFVGYLDQLVAASNDITTTDIGGT